MTLANFNTNFNWQLRMLKEASDCCSIPVPPSPLPPDYCYYYFKFSAINMPNTYTIYDPRTGVYEPLIGDNVGDGVMPDLGGFGNVWCDVLASPISLSEYTCTIGFIAAPGTVFPPVDIRDALNNPVPITYTECCNTGCYSAIVDQSDNIIEQLFTGIGGFVLQGFDPMFGVGPFYLDLNDAASVSSWDFILKRLYGTQVSLSVITLPNGSYFVKLDNVYVCDNPLDFKLHSLAGNDFPFIKTNVNCPVPSPPLTPARLGYWYTPVDDYSCTSFGVVVVPWDLNGSPPANWQTLMASPPYNGGAALYLSPGVCLGGLNTYHMWAVSYVQPIPLIGNDNIGNPASYPLLGPITTIKCFSAVVTTTTNLMIGFNTSEVYAEQNSIIIDLDFAGVNADFSNLLSSFYPSVSVTVSPTGNPFEYDISISAMYTNGDFYMVMNDLTFVQIAQVPC